MKVFLELGVEEGKFLVKLARNAISQIVSSGSRMVLPDQYPSVLQEKAGAFVTLTKLSAADRSLRGCIGFPLPEKSLVEATVEAAIASATQDPRFSAMEPSELNEVLVEVSVLSPPELIVVNSPLEYPNKLRIGIDGLIIKWTLGSGLLLPQVAVEYNLGSQDFLAHACLKAGAPPDCWLLKGTKIYRFQTTSFEELEPGGQAVAKKLL